MEAAFYEDGKFKDWRQIRGAQVEFHSRFNIKACNATCAGIIPGSEVNENLIWMVFAPSSRVLSDLGAQLELTDLGPPINLSMWYGDHDRAGNAYDLTLNTTSGRVTMKPANY